MVTDRIDLHYCIYCGMSMIAPCESFADSSGCVNRDADIFTYPHTSVSPLKEPALTQPMNDKVYQPSHYAKWAIEPVTYVMRNGMEFWRGNIIKYATRAGSKTYDGMDAVESEITDLEKVRRYAEMRINMLKGETVL